MKAAIRLLLGCVLSAAIVSCDALGLGPTDILSIELAPLPFPSVVVGEELRGVSGEPEPLAARVFRGDTELSDATVSFLALDTGFVDISPAGVVTGKRVSTTPVRIIASYDGLQSQPLLLIVTRRPEAVAATVPTTHTLEYLSTEQPLSDPFTIRVSSQGDEPVRGWTVRYEVVEPPDPAEVPGQLMDESSRPSSIDTTDASGTASRRFRLTPSLITNPTGQDTIAVDAQVDYRGAPLPGSPVRFILIVRPRVAS